MAPETSRPTHYALQPQPNKSEFNRRLLKRV